MISLQWHTIDSHHPLPGCICRHWTLTSLTARMAVPGSSHLASPALDAATGMAPQPPTRATSITAAVACCTMGGSRGRLEGPAGSRSCSSAAAPLGWRRALRSGRAMMEVSDGGGRGLGKRLCLGRGKRGHTPSSAARLPSSLCLFMDHTTAVRALLTLPQCCAMTDICVRPLALAPALSPPCSRVQGAGGTLVTARRCCATAKRPATCTPASIQPWGPSQKTSTRRLAH